MGAQDDYSVVRMQGEDRGRSIGSRGSYCSLDNPIVRSNIARALAEAAIPVPGDCTNDLAELEALRVA